MSSDDPLSGIEAAIRTAILSSSYNQARAWLAAYGEAVEHARRALAAEGGDVRALAGRVRQFLQWAHSMALAGQARLGDQLRRLPARSACARFASRGRLRTFDLEA